MIFAFSRDIKLGLTLTMYVLTTSAVLSLCTAALAVQQQVLAVLTGDNDGKPPTAIYDGGYSSADAIVRLRIGNGGAGQSGLVGALADQFIRDTVERGNVSAPFLVRHVAERLSGAHLTCTNIMSARCLGCWATRPTRSTTS